MDFLQWHYFAYFFTYCYQHFKTIKEIILSGGYTSEDNALKAGKSLKIIEASYFSENRNKDVKEKLQNMILDNTLIGTADNILFGDPDHGKDKWLRIKYSINGKQFEKQYNQGEAFKLPPNEPMKK